MNTVLRGLIGLLVLIITLALLIVFIPVFIIFIVVLILAGLILGIVFKLTSFGRKKEAKKARKGKIIEAEYEEK